MLVGQKAHKITKFIEVYGDLQTHYNMKESDGPSSHQHRIKFMLLDRMWHNSITVTTDHRIGTWQQPEAGGGGWATGPN